MMFILNCDKAQILRVSAFGSLALPFPLMTVEKGLPEH